MFRLFKIDTFYQVQGVCFSRWTFINTNSTRILLNNITVYFAIIHMVFILQKSYSDSLSVLIYTVKLQWFYDDILTIFQ